MLQTCADQFKTFIKFLTSENCILGFIYAFYFGKVFC